VFLILALEESCLQGSFARMGL